jgi:hypothetical protein
MKKLLFFVSMVWFAQLANAQTMITIVIKNSGAFNKDIVVLDEECQTNQNFSLAATSGEVSVSICQNSSGYGNITVSGVNTESGNPIAPTQFHLLSPNDNVSF